MDTAALLAPVTAVEFIQELFLLTGEGPVLTVYSLHPHPKVCTLLSVLQHHRIHGIRPRVPAGVRLSSHVTGAFEDKDRLSSITETSCYDVAVFGGKAVRLVRLHVKLQDGDSLHLESMGPIMELHNWILEVRWLAGDGCRLLCVAVAHNSAILLDTITGEALSQCSCLEGCLLYSALLLVDETWADTVVVGGTVFNQLVLWKPGESRNPDCKAPVERRLLGHSGVIFSISYLHEKGWLASASDDRSVRVWGVGAVGGPGGICGDLNPTCLRVLYGHQARVFSVRLSAAKVFSAGEDGACLVWDWAEGGKVVRMLKGHRAGGVRALAVSEGTRDNEAGRRWVATGGADGGVRLWRVEGSEERKEEAAGEKLTDLKFPGQGLPKVVCVAEANGTNGSWSQSTFVVCTDQGMVYKYSDGHWEKMWEGSGEFHSYCVMETITVRTKNSASAVQLCAVGNLSGSVQVFPLSQPQCGIRLTGGSKKIHSLIWQKGEQSAGQVAFLLASGAEGLVYRWCVEVTMKESGSLSLCECALPSFLLPPCAKCWLTAALRLYSKTQGALWVCGDRRGSLLLFQDQNKPEESGGVDGNNRTMEERIRVVKLEPLSCLFGVHGKQGVTSVCDHQGVLYSSGRDGCVRVFRVHVTEKNGERLQLEVLRVQRACKGMEWLERVLILEAEIPKQEDDEEEVCGSHSETDPEEEESNEGCRGDTKAQEARFAIVGFHADRFVVWDPVRQERLLAVPCGGGHRSWALWPPCKGVWPGYAALIFIKQGTVLTSQPPREAPDWVEKAAKTGGWTLKEGIHGRGIGCVCRLGRMRGTETENQTDSALNTSEFKAWKWFREEGKEGYWEVVVTGGDDTSLTVLCVQPETGAVKVLSVITDHISSIRTVTAVSPIDQSRAVMGTESLSALLLSAGGRAQMQCYRLLIGWDRRRLVPTCQVIQVASHRLDEHWERRRNRHKMVKMDPETRYMSLTIVDERTDCVIVGVACSDGAVRLFSVRDFEGRIDLLWENFYHQRCVLSVATCSLEDRSGNRCSLLFSAATDGHIAAWDLTPPPPSLTSSSSDFSTASGPCLSIPAHQSGVNTLAVWPETVEQQEGGCLVTVASGGDDGQLTVSSIRVQRQQHKNPEDNRGSCHISVQTQTPLCLHLMSQCRIPSAHAAALTSLKRLCPDLLVSTSPDQRVCLWRLNSTAVTHTGALCSHVADAAGLAVWEGPERQQEEEEAEVWGGAGSRRGLETERETADETEPAGDTSETGDPVSLSGDRKGGERENQTRRVSNTETILRSSCESRKKTNQTRWVLVSGQGFQLIRVPNAETIKESK
ncbi:WD repeat-containing protein 6 isoform X2 [Thalassophryne amazonica]|nr:WD repeat-containing protein 6 isoform X2 [Thalassophryne amazonica]